MHKYEWIRMDYALKKKYSKKSVLSYVLTFTSHPVPVLGQYIDG